VGSNKKGTKHERSNAAGSRVLQVYNAKVRSKPGKRTGTDKDLLNKKSIQKNNKPNNKNKSLIKPSIKNRKKK